MRGVRVIWRVKLGREFGEVKEDYGWGVSSLGWYRWGYQAQEKDNEIYGRGASYYYRYRQQDARLGRFWSVDPLARKYPWNSPYAFAENRLVDGVEWEGLEYLSVEDAGTNPDAYKNPNGTYSFSLGEVSFSNVQLVEWNGDQYLNVGRHLYYGKDGWSLEGKKEDRMTQWIYTDIDDFDANKMHVYVWDDESLRGVRDWFGKDANRNCAYLACMQALVAGTKLKLGMVSSKAALNASLDFDAGLDYIHRQLEAGKVGVAGVDFIPKGTDHLGTDHYITIVGRTSDKGEGRFIYIENAVGYREGAIDFERNKLAIRQNATIGLSKPWWYYGKASPYKVTRIQENAD